MENYINSIKDFVLETIANESQAQYKANVGDPKGCFRMGMVHLLGVNKTIDFKQASNYFSHKSLADSTDAKLLLGLIAEFEGDFSSAFSYYAEAANKNSKLSYIDKVIKERLHLQNFLKKLGLPIVLNQEISSILDSYKKGDASRVGASIKIAGVCNDYHSCLLAAQTLLESGDIVSASKWINKGNISDEDPFCLALKKDIEKSKKDLMQSKDFQLILLQDKSLVSSQDLTPFLNNVKKECFNATSLCRQEWKDYKINKIDKIIKKQKDKEQKEWEIQQAEAAARERKKKKIIKHSIICAILFFLGAASEETGGISDKFENGIIIVLSGYFWYFLIRWIWRQIKGK